LLFRETPEWKLGRAGEIVLKRMFMARDLLVIPTCDIENGGAPILEGAGARGPVLPDFLVFKDAKPVGAIEVKTRSNAGHFYKLGKHTHGLALRHWNDYLDFQKRTGLTVWLAFYQLSNQRIYIKRLDALALQGHVGAISGVATMFFPVEVFEELDAPDDPDAPEPIPARAETTRNAPPQPTIKSRAL
jgi:hypothetical protein